MARTMTATSSIAPMTGIEIGNEVDRRNDVRAGDAQQGLARRRHARIRRQRPQQAGIAGRTAGQRQEWKHVQDTEKSGPTTA